MFTSRKGVTFQKPWIFISLIANEPLIYAWLCFQSGDAYHVQIFLIPAENWGRLNHIRPRPLPSKYFLIYGSLTVLSYETKDYVIILCSMDRASHNMTIIIQQDTTEYSLFQSVNCSTCFWWYFTRHQELITLYLNYLALMRPVLLHVVNVAGREMSHPATILRCAIPVVCLTVWRLTTHIWVVPHR